MESIKNDSEILAEIYRNAQLGLTSIVDLLPEVDDEEIKEELTRQHEEYEKICSEAAQIAAAMQLELKEPSPVKKAMMWSAIKMNTASDNSRANVAQMMIKGTVQGITSLKTTMGESEKVMNGEIKKLLARAIEMEEGFEKRLKNYL
ncbi:MAG: hypothetical protein ACI4QI_02260 [Candidatus Coproplasma sp.]